MQRVADYIIQRLYEEEVKNIFMVSGGSCAYLTDAVAKHEQVAGIPAHHEQAGMMAALSYAVCNEKLGACIVTTGCGGTNTMTGLLHAYQDSIPCVVVSGQAALAATTRNLGIPLRQLGRQETDIVKIVEPITKYAVMLTSPKEVAYEMDKALHIAKSGRKGPVWIDVPSDIQNMLVDPEKLERYEPEQMVIAADEEEVAYVAEALKKAERPVLFIGNGIRAAGAVEAVRQFVQRSGIPVVYTRMAADIFETDSPQVIGMVNSISGTRAGNFTVQNSDFVLCIGTRLAPDITGFDYENFARAAKLVVVDIDEVEHSKNTVNIDTFIHSDAKVFMEKLNAEQYGQVNRWWIEKCLHWKEIFPVCLPEHRCGEAINMFYFMECFSKVMPNDAAVVSDAGFAGQMVPLGIHFKEGQRSVHPFAQGEMGYSLPGSMGVYCARKTPVFAFMGDGSFMMNMQELQTIAYNKFPIKIIVLNNGGYVCVRVAQEAFFRGRTIGTDPSNGVGFPELARVADAFGISYCKIEGNENLQQKIGAVVKMEGPVLCEVICTKDQDYVHSTYAFNSKRRLVMRPIEDQYPFLDRELFLKEMIIEPVNQ